MRHLIQPLESRRLLAQTIAMYTYAGDMNFDGLVDADDYGVIDNAINFPGPGGNYYSGGDWNYDGVINEDDVGATSAATRTNFSGGPSRDVIVVTPAAGGAAGVNVSINGNVAPVTYATKLNIFGNGGN